MNKKYFFFFPFLFLFFGFLIKALLVNSLQTKVQTVIQANQMMMQYQGMSYDLTGLGPLIKFTLEKENNFDLSYIRIRTNQNFFERNYSSDGNYFFDKVEIEISENDIDLILKAKLNILGLALVSATSLTCSLFLISLVILFNYIFNLKKSKEIADLAKQVSHDIRSPLAALNVAISSMDDLENSKKQIISSAYRRINDIANNLLSQNQHKIISSNLSPVLVSQLIESLMSEKRVLYSTEKFSLNLSISLEAKDVFASLDRMKLERILSNLINNSIEAIKIKGSFVEIALKVTSHLEIVVSDNGPGIPKEVLNRIGESGNTTKKDGQVHGLGLSHAVKAIREMNGEIHFLSKHDTGTEIKIKFPICESPFWYNKYLKINVSTILVIVDDDEATHLLWEERFKSNDLKFVHFYEIRSFIDWFDKHKNQDFFLIIDNFFKNYPGRGLDLINDLKLQQKALLFSSMLDDSEVLHKCSLYGVSCLPKFLLDCLKVEILDQNKFYDLVLIDDDKYVHFTWSKAAEEFKLRIICLTSIDTFIDNYFYLPNETVIFIDSNLKNGVRGELDAKRLFDLKYENLYLATGFQEEDLNIPTWIKGIHGKDPLKIFENISILKLKKQHFNV